MSTAIDLTRNSGVPTEGVHLFKITDGKEQASKTSGDPMWVLALTCQDGGDDKGKVVSMFLSLAPQARFKIDQLLDAVEAPKQGTVTVESMAGKLIKGLVVYGEYNGAPTANIQRMFPASADTSSVGTVSSPAKTTNSIDELSQKKRIPF